MKLCIRILVFACVILVPLLLHAQNQQYQYNWAKPGTGATGTAVIPNTNTTYDVQVKSQGSSGLSNTGCVVNSYDNYGTGAATVCFDADVPLPNPRFYPLDEYDVKVGVEASEGFKFNRNVIDMPQECFNPSTFGTYGAIGNSLKVALNNYIGKNKLNSYQKVCLIHCIISKRLTYDASKLWTSVKSCYSGEGVCGHFSYMFYDLATSIGLEAQMVAGTSGEGESHAFNTVTINNRKYIFDSNRNHCELYTNDLCPIHSYIRQPNTTVVKTACDSTIIGTWKDSTSNTSLSINPNGTFYFTTNDGCKASGTYTCPNKEFYANRIDTFYGSVNINVGKTGSGKCIATGGAYNCFYETVAGKLKFQCISSDAGKCL